MPSLHIKCRDEIPKPAGSLSFLNVLIDVGMVHVIIRELYYLFGYSNLLLCHLPHPQCNITSLFYLETISMWLHDHHSIPVFTTEMGGWKWNSSLCIIWDAEHQCLFLAILKANQISWGRIWGQSSSFLHTVQIPDTVEVSHVLERLSWQFSICFRWK